MKRTHLNFSIFFEDKFHFVKNIDARLSNDASEAQQVDGTNKSEKNAADHQNMTDVNENSQTSQPGLLVKQKATQSAADKSTTSGMFLPMVSLQCRYSLSIPVCIPPPPPQTFDCCNNH